MIARRSIIIASRYTPDEASTIEKKATVLGLDKSELVRKGALVLCGKNVNILPEQVEKYYARILKKKLTDFIGPENGNAIEKLEDFVGKEPKKRNTSR